MAETEEQTTKPITHDELAKNVLEIGATIGALGDRELTDEEEVALAETAIVTVGICLVSMTESLHRIARVLELQAAPDPIMGEDVPTSNTEAEAGL